MSAARLWCLESQSHCRLFQAALDPHRRSVEINGAPREGTDFTAPHSRAERECSDRIKSVPLKPAENVSDLIRGQTCDLCLSYLRWPDRMSHVAADDF